MSKIRACIENLFYDIVWYCVKAFTYTKEYLCCCISKYTPIYDDECSQLQTPQYNFDYNFLVIEIKVNNKSFTMHNYKDYMNESQLFLTKDFVYDFLANEKCVKITGEPEYIITIMDDNTNMITLDKKTCLKLQKSEYKIVNA